MEKEYRQYIQDRLTITLKEEGSRQNIKKYNLRGFTHKQLEEFINGISFSKFCKRCLKSCVLHHGLNWNDIEDFSEKDYLKLITTVDMLCLKLNIEIIHNLIKNPNDRVSSIINEDIFNIIPSLKSEYEEINKNTKHDITYHSFYTCPRCKAKKYTTKEVIARSIDEPAVIKCHCQECGMIFNKG